MMAAQAIKPERVVIFGNTQLASLLWHSLTHDSPHQVVAFTVDRSFLESDRMHDLPVIAFEDLAEQYPAGDHAMMVAIGFKNALRGEKAAIAERKGFRLVSYISSRAFISAGSIVGRHAQIHDDVYVGPFTRIGDNCVIYANARLGHHCDVGDNCYIGGAARTLSNVVIGNNCTLGGACTIRDSRRLAEGSFIAAGAFLAKDTEEAGRYIGWPARRRSH